VVAARAGATIYAGDSLELGDVIYSINTVPVTSIDAMRKTIEGLKEADPLVMQVEREGRLMYLTLEIQ
jgi:S1-C subfamily serine protease